MLFGPLSSWFSLSHSFLTFWILPKTAFKIKNNRHLTRKCAGRQRNRNEIFSFQWLISSTSLAEFPFHGWKTAHPYSFCCTKPCVIQNLGKTPEDSAHSMGSTSERQHSHRVFMVLAFSFQVVFSKYAYTGKYFTLTLQLMNKTPFLQHIP
jgi:hypothetical protein